MTAILLSLHVVAGILLVGPITVAASVFPRYAGAAAGDAERSAAARAVAAGMHRISRGYAVPALAVPAFGIGTAATLGVLGDPWVLVSMALTILAAVLLVRAIIPGQRDVLALLRGEREDSAGPVLADSLRRLRSTTGIFGLLWVVVVVLMITRPGSTTGA